ncbi:hypothetical protein Scep_011569 [Stephania cephalantha]|uniref:Trichome birefringence-like N-terminal domain-containing protein n=1 Tax=Stephania cephalantha TaxID=152367 RepID=A0AAP0P920_9MAGN
MGGSQVLSLFPFALASILAIGIVKLYLENSHSVRIRLHPAGFISPSEASVVSQCNVFDGRWVFDNATRPLYREQSCPYLTKQVTCRKNGRPDSLYQNWRWKPNDCELPKFDAITLLEILRDKTMMLIGDSIQRTQWESLVCLIQSSIIGGRKSLYRDPPMKIFYAEEFNAKIVFYWNPFIVESNSDHALKHTVYKRLVNLDTVEKHSKHWKGVDVLVFESYVWWMYKPVINATNGPSHQIQEYNVTNAYRMAMKTWANWIESNVDPRTQRVFFMSPSPTHLWSWEWRPGSDENCFNETHPIEGRSYWGTGSSIEIMGAVADVLREMKINVTYMNITQLSEFRKDGHTTVYTERRGKLLTKEQKADPKNYGDCIHWCLPGVPDTWNEILYAYLLHDFYHLFNTTQ